MQTFVSAVIKVADSQRAGVKRGHYGEQEYDEVFYGGFVLPSWTAQSL